MGVGELDLSLGIFLDLSGSKFGLEDLFLGILKLFSFLVGTGGWSSLGFLDFL